MKADGPAATLDYLRTTKLINVYDPEKSILLLKPLAAVKHGGGKKFVPGDEGYKAFRDFIDDYAKAVRDEYAKADDLPKADGPERFGSDAWLKLSNTPPEWGDKLLQVDLYAWDAAKNDWQSAPIASSDRVVWGKGRLWQHNLALLAPRGSAAGVESRQTGVAERQISRESVRGREGPPGGRLEGATSGRTTMSVRRKCSRAGRRGMGR